MGRNSQFKCAQKATQNPSDFTGENFFSLAVCFCKTPSFQKPFLNPKQILFWMLNFPLELLSNYFKELFFVFSKLQNLFLIWFLNRNFFQSKHLIRNKFYPEKYDFIGLWFFLSNLPVTVCVCVVRD